MAVSGIADLLKTFHDLGHMTSDLRDVAIEAMTLPRNAARRHAPVRSGLLQSTITVTELAESSDKELHIGMGIFAEDAVNYPIYVEYGTGIYAENGQGRKTQWVYPCVTEGGLSFFTTSGMHPQPFIRPAWDEEKENAKNHLKQGIIAKLERLKV